MAVQSVGQCGAHAADAGAPPPPHRRARRGRSDRARRDGSRPRRWCGSSYLGAVAPSPPAPRSGSGCASESPGWHTYWMNPGDSGEPPTIDVDSCPPGFSARARSRGRIPSASRVGPGDELRLHGRGGAAVPITAPAGLAPGARVTLRGQASWLVCEKMCIPEEAPVALDAARRRRRPTPDPRGAAARSRARAPRGARRRARGRRRSPPRRTRSRSPWPRRGLAPRAHRRRRGSIPTRWGAIEHAARPAGRASTPGGDDARVARGALPEAVDGADRRRAGDHRAARRRHRRAGVRRAGRRPARPASAGATALLRRAGARAGRRPRPQPDAVRAAGALGEGARRWSATRARRARRRGARRSPTRAGVLVSFAALAGALLALRAGGEQIGWGFQLQSPLVRDAARLPAVRDGARAVGRVRRRRSARRRRARRWRRGAGYARLLLHRRARHGRGHAVHGAVHGRRRSASPSPSPGPRRSSSSRRSGSGWRCRISLLTPGPGLARASCRGPGAVDGAARAAPGVSAVRLGGVARLGAEPAGRAAGRGARRSAGSCCIALRGLALQASPARRDGAALAPRWPRAVARRWPSRSRSRAHLAARRAGRPARRAARRGWEPFSPRRLAELRAAGTPVFVNFTAAWCITCLVNERVALRSPAVAEAFARKGVVTLKADWTSRDAEITACSARSAATASRSTCSIPGPGRAAGREPAVLPQILSEGTVHRGRRARSDRDNPRRRSHVRCPTDPSHVPRSHRPRRIRRGAVRRRARGAASAPRPPKVGAAAPDLHAAVATTGRTVSLADYRGKVVVLEWTNHECPYVRKHYETRQHAGAPEGGDRPGRRSGSRSSPRRRASRAT